MWSGIEKILEHVTKYSTNAGKLWYLLVFVFRLIVVVTIGQSVYSDEQSAFRCSTKVIGCDNVCYDRFSKISHIRYWAFQLLAVTAPAVVFHFYSLNVQSRIAKVKAEEASGMDDDDSNAAGSLFDSYNYDTEDEMKKIKIAARRKRNLRRRKSVGAIKNKQIFENNNFIDVTYTREIRIAYLVNVFLRVVLEAISLYIAYQLFHFVDYTVEASYNPFDLIMIKVPQVFRCAGENVEWACGQHMSLGGQSGYVPCWVSRPWEKTIFMCYMNVLSALCLVLSFIEFVQLLHRYSSNMYRKNSIRKAAKRKLSQRNASIHEPTSFHSVDEIDGKAHDTPGKKIVFGSPSYLERAKERNKEPDDDNERNRFAMTPDRPAITPTIAKKNPDRSQRALLIPTRSPVQQNGSIPKRSVDHVYREIPFQEVAKKMPVERRAKKKRPKTKTKSTVGITVHDEDDDDDQSVGSLYHSSEYERSSDEEEEESLASVSVASGGSA